MGAYGERKLRFHTMVDRAARDGGAKSAAARAEVVRSVLGHRKSFMGMENTLHKGYQRADSAYPSGAIGRYRYNMAYKGKAYAFWRVNEGIYRKRGTRFVGTGKGRRLNVKVYMGHVYNTDAGGKSTLVGTGLPRRYKDKATKGLNRILLKDKRGRFTTDEAYGGINRKNTKPPKSEQGKRFEKIALVPRSKALRQNIIFRVKTKD